MEEKELLIRQDISNELYSISEKVITGEFLYEDYPFEFADPCNNNTMIIKYGNQIPKPLYRKIIQVQLEELKYWLDQKLDIGVAESLETIYPNHSDVNNEFIEWVKEREGPDAFKNSIISRQDTKRISILPIIKPKMKEHFSEFKFGKGNVFRGLTRFKEQWNTKCGIYIIVDSGTILFKHGISIGIDNPPFIIDIPDFYPGLRSEYFYDTIDDVNNNVEMIIKTLEYILPIFKDSIGPNIDRYL